VHAIVRATGDQLLRSYIIFNTNRRIRSKSYGDAKIRDILHPGKTQAGTRDTEAEIRDVPGNTGRLASLIVI